ncbi:chromosome partitioning protein, partial [Rhodococcus opacus PD630]
MAAVRAIADRREGLARLSGQVDTLRTRADSVDAEVSRLTVAIEEARQRGDAAQSEFEVVQDEIGDLDAGELGLDSHHERAVEALRLITERVTELQAEERAAGQEVASLRARIDALAMGLERKDGAGWLVENRGEHGIRGPIGGLITVEKGYEGAVAAAMGPAADAVVAESLDAARSAVGALKETDSGRASLFIGTDQAAANGGHLDSGARWAVDVIDCPAELRTGLAALLGGVVVVDSLDDAVETVRRRPDVRAVTREGDLLGAGWMSGGSDRQPSTLEVQAAIDNSVQDLARAERRAEELAAALSGAVAEQADRQENAEQALAALNESDAAMSAIYERLGRLGQAARAAHAESDRLMVQRDKAESGREDTLTALAELEERLRLAEQDGSSDGADTGGTDTTSIDREMAAAALAEVRAVEVEARLSV